MAKWVCDCGNAVTVARTRVRNGYTQSCGCLSKEVTIAAKTKHGMRYSREYSSWIAMLGRCTNENHKDFPKYGAVGIAVCSEWIDSFEAFYTALGPRPLNTTLDRYPRPDGNYEPGNCRWATPREQSHNRRDLTIVVTPLGKMALVDYAKHIGLSKGAAHLRLKRGKLEGVSHV